MQIKFHYNQSTCIIKNKICKLQPSLIYSSIHVRKIWAWKQAFHSVFTSHFPQWYLGDLHTAFSHLFRVVVWLPLRGIFGYLFALFSLLLSPALKNKNLNIMKVWLYFYFQIIMQFDSKVSTFLGFVPYQLPVCGQGWYKARESLIALFFHFLGASFRVKVVDLNFFPS